ncbi:MAG TPA: hypothetical protein VFX18_06090 [Candidatus Nitrosocosmicus sp.]|nr:hypothetical protein [Candidatus Nitrosocosmicus sp.]
MKSYYKCECGGDIFISSQRLIIRCLKCLRDYEKAEEIRKQYMILEEGEMNGVPLRELFF